MPNRDYSCVALSPIEIDIKRSLIAIKPLKYNMKTYKITFYPIIAIVEEAKNKEEAKEEAIKRFYNGEYECEVVKVEEDKENA